MNHGNSYLARRMYGSHLCGATWEVVCWDTDELGKASSRLNVSDKASFDLLRHDYVLYTVPVNYAYKSSADWLSSKGLHVHTSSYLRFLRIASYIYFFLSCLREFLKVVYNIRHKVSAFLSFLISMPQQSCKACFS